MSQLKNLSLSMALDKNFTCKESVCLDNLMEINPILGLIFYYFVGYAYNHDLPVVITSIIDNHPRKTRTHAEGRAIDISSKNWPNFHIQRILYKINSTYRDYGTGPVNKPKQAIIHHDAGSGFHFHIQVNRLARLED